MKRLLLLTTLLGCKGELNPAYCAAHPSDTRCTTAGLDGNTTRDGAGSNDSGADVTPVCLGTGTYQVCVPPPTMDLTISVAINTSTSTACVPAPTAWTTTQGQYDACFIVAKNLTLSGTYNIRGARPLVLVGTDTVTLTGAFDLAAHKADPNQNPPGYNAALCQPVAAQNSNNNGGGGGAGGSFGTKGGDGGNGDANVAGSIATNEPFPTVLHAGCPGSQGGAGNGMGTAGLAGLGGIGGGAMYIVAGTSIALSDATRINASGAPGAAGMFRSGGGGGGTGGMLVFSAPVITVGLSTFIMANGGGGASGGGPNTDGKPGQDAVDGNPYAQAIGGSSPPGGAGGAGFAFNGTVAVDGVKGTAGSSGNGGGGGGGGAGIIIATRAFGATAGVSPQPQN